MSQLKDTATKAWERIQALVRRETGPGGRLAGTSFFPYLPAAHAGRVPSPSLWVTERSVEPSALGAHNEMVTLRVTFALSLLRERPTRDSQSIDPMAYDLADLFLENRELPGPDGAPLVLDVFVDEIRLDAQVAEAEAGRVWALVAVRWRFQALRP